MPKKIAVESLPQVVGSSYPSPFGAACAERVRQRLGNAADLTQFGVNLTRLPPGSWSSQRHWHSGEDELVYILEGEVVLVTNSGEEILRKGDCAGFKAGVADGHHLQNRSDRDVLLLEIGARRDADDEVFYSDIDLHLPKGRGGWQHNNGEPY
jgi:uncharacterized cupin superfamily protein